MRTNDDNRIDDELLSALMDGELTAAEQARALERLQAEPALQRRWARYHAARAVLTTGTGRLSPDFAERVGRARGQERAVALPRREHGAARSWLRPAAGLAIAASVALVAFGSLMLLRDPASEAPVTVAERTTQEAPGAGEPAATEVTPVAIATGAGLPDAHRALLRQRMMVYLASHSEYAGVGDMPTVVPYGRLGSFNAGQ